MSIRLLFRLACVVASAATLAGCLPGSSGNIAPALKQLSAETQVLLAKAGMTQEAPILVRIFKEESQLEIWKEKPDGRYYHFKTYPICTWSGELGPKVREGDKQAPEGFYTVTPGQMNPNSQFHLSFNLGYPNNYDKVNGHTGGALMVHGDCRSAGCFAMTDALIEEIYALAREAFRGGQTNFHVHAFPFRMTAENMKRHQKSKWYGFWKTLKIGYDDFELTRMPPKVAVCSRQYLVNAEFLGHIAKPDPAASCPAYRRAPPDRFNPFGNEQITATAPETTGSSNSRLASYSGADQTPIPAEAASSKKADEPASKPAAPVKDHNTGLSSDPVRTGASTASATRSPEPEKKVVSVGTPDTSGGADQEDQQGPDQREQPATISLSAAAENPDAEKPAKKDVVTHGMHNVVETGKGDMIQPKTP